MIKKQVLESFLCFCLHFGGHSSKLHAPLILCILKMKGLGNENGCYSVLKNRCLECLNSISYPHFNNVNERECLKEIFTM